MVCGLHFPGTSHHVLNTVRDEMFNFLAFSMRGVFHSTVFCHIVVGSITSDNYLVEIVWL